MCPINRADKLLYKLICALSAFTMLFSAGTLPADAAKPPDVSSAEGRMSASYGYVLNDIIFEYGAMKTGAAGDAFTDPAGGDISPGGTVYAELIPFDADKLPYLAVFTANSDTKCAEIHIWGYDEERRCAVKTAELSKPYGNIEPDSTGSFSVGSDGGKYYIAYRTSKNGVPGASEYYTVIDGEAYMYVNTPQNLSDTGVMEFNRAYFKSFKDISDYNKTLDDFFTQLKNTAADSVTYEDIAERLSPEDESEIEGALSAAVSYNYFDIADYNSMSEYRAALDTKTCSDRFYLITNMYDLGDEIYYVRFSTDRSFYNYTLLRRSNSAENGYQILTVATDCIPLSDSELKQLKEEYSRNMLLFKKAPGSLRLKSGVELDLLDSGLPELKINKLFDPNIKAPAALIGGGISLALLTALWFILLADDDE